MLSQSSLFYPEDDFKELLRNVTTSLQYYTELHSGSSSTIRNIAAYCGLRLPANVLRLARSELLAAVLMEIQFF
jgi:hypothetical protein